MYDVTFINPSHSSSQFKKQNDIKIDRQFTIKIEKALKEIQIYNRQK